jgi:hypothetical protein
MFSNSKPIMEPTVAASIPIAAGLPFKRKIIKAAQYELKSSEAHFGNSIESMEDAIDTLTEDQDMFKPTKRPYRGIEDLPLTDDLADKRLNLDIARDAIGEAKLHEFDMERKVTMHDAIKELNTEDKDGNSNAIPYGMKEAEDINLPLGRLGRLKLKERDREVHVPYGTKYKRNLIKDARNALLMAKSDSAQAYPGLYMASVEATRQYPSPEVKQAIEEEEKKNKKDPKDMPIDPALNLLRHPIHNARFEIKSFENLKDENAMDLAEADYVVKKAALEDQKKKQDAANDKY